MSHYRIIASIWFLFGVVGLAFNAIECVRLMRFGDPLNGGGIFSTSIGLAFCLLAAATAIGLFRARDWARTVVSTVTVLLGLYCLSFIAMVGLEFGAIAYAASWLGLALVAYSCIVIWVLRPHDHAV